MSNEKFKTEHTVFDGFTNRNLFKLIGQNHFEGLRSPIATGKESNVFSAKKKDEEVIVKIYRLETCDFNKMYDYIKYDTRYLNIKKQRRVIIFSWAQREFRNLHKAREANVSVPLPIVNMHNIIVMEKVGGENIAPQLKNKYPEDPDDFLEQIIKNLQKLYKAGLVHGDLSEFNILNNSDRPVLIDFSQSTTVKSTNSDELLERDCKNLVRFFAKLGLDRDWKEMVKKIKE